MWPQRQCNQDALHHTFINGTVAVLFRVEQSEFMEFSEVSAFCKTWKVWKEIGILVNGDSCKSYT